MIALAETIIQEIAGVCECVEIAQIEEVIRCIGKNKRIFVVGEGRSGLIVKCFAMRLMHLGYEVYVLGETINPAMHEDDVLVAVSGSGKSETVLIHVKKAKAIGSAVIGISAKKESKLFQSADCCLYIPGTVKQDAQRRSIQLLSTLFDQSLHVILDMVVLMISQSNQIGNEQAANNHY